MRINRIQTMCWGINENDELRRSCIAVCYTADIFATAKPTVEADKNCRSSQAGTVIATHSLASIT